MYMTEKNRVTHLISLLNVCDCNFYYFHLKSSSRLWHFSFWKRKKKKNKWNEKSERTNERNKWCTLHIIYMLWYDTIYMYIQHSLAFCLSFTHCAVLPSMPKLSAPPFYIFASVCVHMYIHFKAFAFGWCVRNREKERVCVWSSLCYAVTITVLCAAYNQLASKRNIFFPIVCRLFSVQYTQNWMWLD